MALEALIQDLIDAVKENTAAHTKLGEIAKGAAKAPTTSTKATEPEEDNSDSDEEAKKAAAAEKRKAAAAKKKADAEAKKKAEDAKKKGGAPEIPASVETAELRGLARTFMAKDNEKRAENKANFEAALAHLGAERLSDVTGDDEAKLFAYITYWSEGSEVDFEAVDERLAGMSGDDDSDDDLMS